MYQLPVEIFDEIFKYLEFDKISLNSCLLVNRLWCKVSVKIFWKSIRNYNTLIACLPDESKEILYENGILISTSMPPPTFNYISFCKFLSIKELNYNIQKFFNNNQQKDITEKMSKEIFKFLIKNISSLKELTLDASIINIPFFSYPETFTYLSKLTFSSNTDPKLLYQLSQICHNIQTMYIPINDVIPNELTYLISLQQKLTCLCITQFNNNLGSINNIFYQNIPNTLTRIFIYEGSGSFVPLSFIGRCLNLQTLMLSFPNNNSSKSINYNFKKLQNINFSKLQSLEFRNKCPKNDLLETFLKINGRNLKELSFGKSNDSLNIIISNSCPNLKKLFITNLTLETLEKIFNRCHYLESIKICCEENLSTKDLFEIIINDSPVNFYELQLINVRSKLIPEELESFLVNWIKRIPQKQFFLNILTKDIRILNIYNENNKKIFKKYVNHFKLGHIKSR
ncbi:hypothetical protein C1645_879499 [Glomus cerebriforme]|uniref:F-box domain-containing protein n=1 Tax=Glomus cerebriforme TaxID=658196 RepID=A0A397SKH5_9GLOM|nr:hypothetical protein C1645_879499 [Glomus cerebriforme]